MGDGDERDTHLDDIDLSETLIDPSDGEVKNVKTLTISMTRTDDDGDSGEHEREDERRIEVTFENESEVHTCSFDETVENFLDHVMSGEVTSVEVATAFFNAQYGILETALNLTKKGVGCIAGVRKEAVGQFLMGNDMFGKNGDLLATLLVKYHILRLGDAARTTILDLYGKTLDSLSDEGGCIRAGSVFANGKARRRQTKSISKGRGKSFDGYHKELFEVRTRAPLPPRPARNNAGSLVRLLVPCRVAVVADVQAAAREEPGARQRRRVQHRIRRADCNGCMGQNQGLDPDEQE